MLIAVRRLVELDADDVGYVHDGIGAAPPPLMLRGAGSSSEASQGKGRASLKGAAIGCSTRESALRQ
jgi:hypothetical protein